MIALGRMGMKLGDIFMVVWIFGAGFGFHGQEQVRLGLVVVDSLLRLC